MTLESDFKMIRNTKYTKYFKMLKIGLSMGAVKNVMIRNGKDPAVVDGDHNQPAQMSKRAFQKHRSLFPKTNTTEPASIGINCTR